VVAEEDRCAKTAGRPPGPDAKLSDPGNQTPFTKLKTPVIYPHMPLWVPVCGPAVGCGVCVTPELRRGAAGLCAPVRSCAGAAESIHAYILRLTLTPLVSIRCRGRGASTRQGRGASARSRRETRPPRRKSNSFLQYKQTRTLFTHTCLFGYLLGVVAAEHRRAQTAGRPPGPGAKLSNPGKYTPFYSRRKHARYLPPNASTLLFIVVVSRCVGVSRCGTAAVVGRGC